MVTGISLLFLASILNSHDFIVCSTALNNSNFRFCCRCTGRALAMMMQVASIMVINVNFILILYRYILILMPETDLCIQLSCTAHFMSVQTCVIV